MNRGIGCVGEDRIIEIFKEPCADSGMNITADNFDDQCTDYRSKAYYKLYDS